MKACPTGKHALFVLGIVQLRWTQVVHGTKGVRPRIKGDPALYPKGKVLKALINRLFHFDGRL